MGNLGRMPPEQGLVKYEVSPDCYTLEEAELIDEIHTLDPPPGMSCIPAC